MPPGGRVGTIPSDMDQATGLERLEILGKMQGVDIFDMRPLDSSRKGEIKTRSITKRLAAKFPSEDNIPNDGVLQELLITQSS